MKYRLTVLNLAAGILIAGTIINTIIHNEKLSSGEGWGILFMIGLIGVGIVGFILDFFVQIFTNTLNRKSRNRTRNIIGVIVLLSVYYYTRYQSRSIIVNVPEGYDGIVALVCNVPNQPRIKRNIFTLNAEIDLPANGIIWTSSVLRDNDIPYTDFKYPSGEFINISGTWNNLHSDILSYPCNGQTVTFRISNLMGKNGEERIEKKIEEIKFKLSDSCVTY